MSESEQTENVPPVEQTQVDDSKTQINSTSGNEGKLFVGGLAKITTVESLKNYFQTFGEVKDVSIKMDPNTQQSRGFGFVLFQDESAIQKVLDAAPHSLDGRKIDPKKAERRDGKMFVGGVKGETSDEAIIEYFEKFGIVETVDRPVDKSTGKNKSFCFVTFKKDGVMKLAVKERFHEIEGKRCETKEGVPKQEMNRHQHEHHNYGAYARGGYGGYSGYHHHAYYQSYGNGGFGYSHPSQAHYGHRHSMQHAFPHIPHNNSWQHAHQHNAGWGSGEGAYNPGNRGGRGHHRGHHRANHQRAGSSSNGPMNGQIRQAPIQGAAPIQY